MDYEKKYKEALSRARAIIEDYKNRRLNDILSYAQEDLSAIFPELKISKNERIRKALIDGFTVMKESKNCGKTFSNHNIPVADILAWLEKQGEQKSAWTPMDEQRVENLLAIIKGHGYPGEVAWLNSLKDRVQPKQEWSEEDKNIICFLINVTENYRIRNGFSSVLEQGDKAIDWLKSLRQQSQWKPSDEQIKVCKEVYADILSAKGFDLGTVNSELNRLEEQLKNKE